MKTAYTISGLALGLVAIIATALGVEPTPLAIYMLGFSLIMHTLRGA